MAEYERKPNKFLLRGMNLTLPGDRLSLEWAQLLKNVRSYRVGEWRQRPGLELTFDTLSNSPVLWLTRLNDISANNYKLFAGTESGNIYGEAATLIDSGYGDQGYSSFVARPDSSPTPYLFVGNASRQSKIDINSNRTEWGLATPTAEPIVAIEQPAYAIVNDCDSDGGFVGTGGTVSVQSRINTTISYILYDNGGVAGDWACCSPAAMDENWQEGLRVIVSGLTETVIVDSVYPAITNTTVEAIAYDSGTTGLCCVQLAIPILGLQRDMLLLLGTEPVRVLSVTDGVSGIPSFRCSTVGTISAGDTVTGLRSFRAVFGNLHSAGETLTGDYLQLAVAASGLSSITKPLEPLDLSQTNSGFNRPMQQDDFIHISIKVSDFSAITELQLQFDVDAAVNDFTQNYYFKSIRPPDLQAAVSQSASSLTAQQQQIQRQQIDELTRSSLQQQRQDLMSSLGNEGGTGSFFGVQTDEVRNALIADIDRQLGNGFTTVSGQGPLSSPGTSGSNQWTELKIPIKEFQRVGSDSSRSWQDVQNWGLTVNSTAAVNVGIDSVWIGGTFGPDFSAGILYTSDPTSSAGGLNYIYRFRNSSTGATSGFSPPLRSVIYPHRQGVLVTGDLNYADPQADYCDYFRIGGTLGQYYLVGSTPITSLQLLDTIEDSDAIRNEVAVFDTFKPWVTTDVPQSGTCDVVGTSVTILTGQLSTEYVRNNQILINNQVYTFHTNPSDSTHVQLNETAGALSNVNWTMQNPTLEGQPLPVVFGPYAGSSGEFYFGLGDTNNPGILYFTIGNNPEAVSDVNYLEVSSPNEPLIGGCVLDGRIFVWSSKQSWIILPSFNGGASSGSSLFYPQLTAMGKGLASSWAVTAGDRLYWVAWDGIWVSQGEAIQSLTDESLSAIFKHDGTEVEGGPFQGIPPIDFSASAVKWLSLCYSKDGLYFTFLGTDGAHYTMFYSFLTQGWLLDEYTSPVTRFNREEGASVDTVFVGLFDGITAVVDSAVIKDISDFITCQITTREEDWDDSRADKKIGDQMIDCNPGGASVLPTLQFDNNSSQLALTALTGSSRERFIRDIDYGVGQYASRVAINLTWATDSGRAYLYEWQPAALRKMETIVQRATDWDTGGYNGMKWVQGCRICADTFDVDKEVTIEFTDGSLEPLTLHHNGEQTIAYWWDPHLAHEMRLIGTNLDTPNLLDWKLLKPIEWIFEPEPDIAETWEPQATSLDLPGYEFIQYILLPHRSTAELTLELNFDNGVADTYTIPTSVGQRVKHYQVVRARKGKLVKFRITSSAVFSIYAMDLEVRAKAWGITGSSFQVFKPFGDISRTQGGARI